jgi:hypothetical protein
MAATFQKAYNVQVAALANLAASAQVISAAIDVSSLISLRLFIRFGRNSATNFTNSPSFRWDVSYKSTGPPWLELYRMTPVLGSSLKAQAVNGICAAGQNVIPLASTTNLQIGDLIYVKSTTIANSEFCRITAITANVSITVEENLVNAQTGSTVYRGAEIFVSPPIDVSSLGSLRLVADNANNANALDYEAYITEAVSFG